MPERIREVIADTSPLRYLHQVELLELLPTLYGSVTLPQAVAEELANGRAREVDVPDPALCPWMQVRPVGAPFLALPRAMGPGEQAALTLASRTPNSLLLLDDGLARRQARLLGIAFTGTLGVLLKARDGGHLTAIAPVLDRLEELRFRLHPRTRAAVLKLAGEAS